MQKLARLRGLFLPTAIGLTLGVMAGWYYLIWLPLQHRYLDERNFRLLAVLSQEIQSSINNFDKMLDNASDSGITDKDDVLKDYLKQLAPQLKVVEGEDLEVIGDDYGDPPNIAVRADEGTHFLYLAFKRTVNKETTKYAVRTDLDKLIGTLLPPTDRNPFDALLIANTDGTVVFQKSSQVLVLAKVDVILEESAAGKTGKAEPIDVKSLSRSSRLIEMTAANAHYRLYSQPLLLSLPLINPGKKSAESKATRQPEQWVLCGLVRAEAFRLESQSISRRYILLASAAILLALFAPPFLKLVFSSPSERLRARDVVVTAVSAFIVTGTLTFILLDLYYWRKNFAANAEQEMQEIAIAIDHNFVSERNTALNQLESLSKTETLRNSLREAQRNASLPRFEPNTGGCDQKTACRVEILRGDIHPELSQYPNLLFASWTDSNGNQRVKWTTKGHVTPFLNLDEPSIVYYPSIKDALGDPGAGGSNPVPTKGIGSQYSPNTGENITVFWELLDMNGNPVTAAFDPKQVFCASLVTRPISVVRPILPAEYHFAIIRPDGLVIFHSDPTRNLHENFLAETDQNPELRSRVSMRSEGLAFTKYMGQGHRLYIFPMSAELGEPWTVVVFRDLRAEETMNLEVLSLASIMFVLYAVLMALTLTSVHWILSGRGVRSWLWPDSRRVGRYWRLVAINGFAILLLFGLSELPNRLARLFFAVFIPVGALVYNLVILERASDASGSKEVEEKTRASRWQVLYAGTFATLLVVAALPCLSFFKVAWDFEQKLFIERSQHKLIDEIHSRRQFVRSTYQAVKLADDYKKQLLVEPVGEEPRLFSYHNHFHHTTINAVPKSEEFPPAQGALGGVASLERSVDVLLAVISPLLNDIAYDNRYVAEPSLPSRGSSLTSSEDNNGMQLTEARPDDVISSSRIRSSWTLLHIPWGDWIWWLGTLAYLAVVFLLVRFILRRIFLLDLTGPDTDPLAVLKSDNLITNLSKNLVVIGPRSSPIIANLVRREEVQACDLCQMLSVPKQQAATAGGGSVAVSIPNNPVEEILRNDRPVVFQDFERGLDDPDSSQQIVAALKEVLSRLHKTVVITSNVDPLAKLWGEKQEQLQTLLQPFVWKDINLCAARRVSETAQEFDDQISIKACYDWLFSSCPEAQKLVLVQLAQEKLINPNSRSVVRELMKEGLIVRSCGMLTIWGTGFAKFLEAAVPQADIKSWEKHGAGIHADAFRTSLLVAGTALAIFLLYTQGALVDSWVKYAAGIATSIPAILKMFDMFRRGLAPGTQVS